MVWSGSQRAQSRWLSETFVRWQLASITSNVSRSSVATSSGIARRSTTRFRPPRRRRPLMRNLRESVPIGSFSHVLVTAAFSYYVSLSSIVSVL